MRIKLIILMLLIVLFTVFVVQNTEPVNMQLFFWHITELPKIILLTVTLVIGVLLGFIVASVLNKQKKSVEKKSEPLSSVTTEAGKK